MAAKNTENQTKPVTVKVVGFFLRVENFSCQREATNILLN